MAQKRIFTQQKFEVVEVDGCKKVVVPKEVFVGAKPLWEDFIIRKFLNTKDPHVGKIHMIVNKIWRLGDRSSLIDVFEVNESTITFRVRIGSMRQRILHRGMWNITDIPMIVSKWTPFAEEAQPAMKLIPLWVTLSNIPLTMFTDKGLEFLASAVGKPIRLHPKIESCVSFDEAQLLVEADLTKGLPKECAIMGEEDGELDSVINYSYPWLPPRCTYCKKWGHLHSTCLSAEARDTQAPSSSAPIMVVTEEVKETTLSPPIALEKEKSLATTEDLTTGKGVDVDIEKEDGGEWIKPNMNRSSSGLKKKKSSSYGEVSILSNSYSVLGEKADTEEENKTEEAGEAEIPSRVSGSGFVDQEVQTGTAQSHDAVSKSRVSKVELPPRPSLPRGSKTAHKIIPQHSASFTSDPSRDQSKKHHSKHH